MTGPGSRPSIDPAPPTRRDPLVETLHGVDVADPYRWLEDGDDPDVRRWVAAHNDRSRAHLDALTTRSQWRAELEPLVAAPTVATAQVRAGTIVTLERRSGDEQLVLVSRAADELDRVGRRLVDPADGVADAAASIDWYSLSPDGALVAFGLSEGGTENSTLHLVAADGVDDPALAAVAIPRCRAASVAWDADGRGFHYTRYPEGDEYHRTVHHHRIGREWADDPVVWAEHPTPQTWPDVTGSHDGRWLLVTAMVGWGRTDLHLLDRTDGTWRTLVEGVEAVTDLVFADDATLIGSTTLGASRGRVVSVRVDAADIGPAAWHELVPERSGVLTAVRPSPVGWWTVVTTEGVDAVEHWSQPGKGSASPVTVDRIGIASVPALSVDPRTGDAVAVVTSFDRPAGLWRLHAGPDGADGAPVGEPTHVDGLQVRHEHYRSDDGTEIGMFLVEPVGTAPDLALPTVLTGYGGFSITETPVFSPMIAAWCRAGGRYAIAGLRGGAEHGEEWHDAGRRGNKQHVFDDFAAGARWLVASGATTHDRLAIAGGSNGGLLVGATLTQHPEICRAVWCAVPLLDMIRFPRFLIARLWTDEYGDPDIAEQFGWLIGYSPYHRVGQGVDYPAVLLTTADGDTRVDPMHARKMAAALLWAVGDRADRPILLHQAGRAGHGAGKPVSKRAEEAADVLAFFADQLGVER